MNTVQVEFFNLNVEAHKVLKTLVRIVRGQERELLVNPIIML